MGYQLQLALLVLQDRMRFPEVLLTHNVPQEHGLIRKCQFALSALLAFILS